jgi:hypothetical protein
MKNAIRSLALATGSTFALSAAAANLIPNSDFDTGMDGWTVVSGEGTATLDETTGSPAAPSLHLAGTAESPDISVESDCLAVDDSENVDLYADINGTAGFAMLTINAYDDTECSNGIGAINSEAFPATGEWDTYSMSDVMLPDGAQSAKVVLSASMGASTSPGDVHFDHVGFGETGTVFAPIAINQEGLSGTWYNPATSGQGMQFQISPDDGNPTEGTLFGAWYTYDVTAGSESAQRWYSIQSELTGAAESIDVTIYQNTGGNFDAPPSTSAVAVGTGTLSFDSCVSGSFTYAFGDGRTGTIPLQRLMSNVNCTETGAPDNPPSDFGFTGAWYNPTTSGQGLVAEINPADAQAFFGWYTYTADGESNGAAGQHWFSAQAPYTVGARTIDLVVYESSGGSFDQSGGVVTDPVGTATLTFESCSSAMLDYAFDAGELEGRSGTIPLSRLGATPASCVFAPPSQ